MTLRQETVTGDNANEGDPLAQAREREAALRGILQVISRSRDDEAPVFDAILENARRLCGAPMAALVLGRPGDAYQILAAHHGAKDTTVELYRSKRYPMDPKVSFAAKAIVEGRVVHLEDMADTQAYRDGDENVHSLVDDQGIRTNLFVPLIAKDGAIGCLILFRTEVRPYTDSQIELVETFAAQAVIAIENVRQFRALEASNEEVRAQADELKALNSELESRVEAQVSELERMGRLKRFLSPQVADAIVSSGNDKMLSSHRALLGILFCDIRGFTAFCETAEPEETIEVLQTYHEEMGKLIVAHGAGVDHRSGDGIMVLFNDPLPCDDPAGDALRLALAMRERMAELCKIWKRLGHHLGFGVGVSLGYATVGMVGSEGRFDYTASGTAVNLASRLCDAAEDGEILISPRAYTAVEGDFTTESAGELSLKGMRAAVEVFRVLGPRSDQSESEDQSPR